jgi:hypothetical protein
MPLEKNVWVKYVAVLVAIYLTCDAIWLIGDNAPWLGEAYRPVLRAAAQAIAVAAFAVMAVRTSIVHAAGISTGAIIGAALIIIPVSVIWFPRQFPRDSSVPQFLIWVGVELLMLCGVAAVVAVALATFGEYLRKARG